jgi:Zn-dependent peptidase ImmA (M78 family)/transcriptional regulator with XRE-family HTH domain
MHDQAMALFGSRLRTARKMAGMSLEDLSGRIGGVVTRQAISKYEKGRMMPSPEVFERLNSALGAQPVPGSMAQISTELQSPGAMSGLGMRKQFRLQRAASAPEGESTRWETLSSPLMPFSRLAEEPDNVMESQRNYREHSAPARLLRSEAAPDADSALGQIRFRGREKLAAKTAVALKLRVEDYVKRCLEVESVLGLEQAFANPLAGRAVGTSADVETAALDVRRAWDIGSAPVINLLGLLEEKGIRVFELRGIEGFEGLSGNYGTGPFGESVPFITVNRDFPADRMRFTAAHELGHLLCGFPERESAESLCHAFAAALLLPRNAIEKALMPARRKISLWELKELKESYGISLQAIMYRARSLGLVADRQVRNFRETMKANGWLVTEPVEYRGNEQTSRLRRLLSYGVAESIIAPERAAALAGVSAAEFRGELGNVF